MKFFNLFKRIKSPVGETVSDESYDKGVEYMTDENTQYCYACYKEPFYNTDGLYPAPFADWLESQGARLV